MDLVLFFADFVNFVAIKKVEFHSGFHFRTLVFSGRTMSVLGPQNVGHACGTTGSRGISMPTFLSTAGSARLPTPTGISHIRSLSSLFTVCINNPSKNNNLLKKILYFHTYLIWK